MKTLHSLTAALLLAAASTAPVAAQSFDLSWFSLDGGGGTSTGATYALSGTMGQPDGGTVTGGPYTCQGGFWAMPSSPCAFGGIRLEPLGNGRVRVSWPLRECGLVLYHSTTLAAWLPFPPPYQTNATHLSVIRSERAEFFLLRQP